MEEVWKDIKGYERLYQISNFGNVRSLDRVFYQKNPWGFCSTFKYKGRKISPTTNRNGYYYVDLTNRQKRKRFYVHRLVAESFIPKDCNRPHINHKDLNKKNNNVENLEWCSREENMRHAVKNNAIKYKSKEVRCIETGKIFKSVSAASKIINRHPHNLRSTINGYSHTCAGFHWEYV